MDMRPDRIAFGRIEPRVRRQLLEAKRNALLVFIELEHLHLDLVADVDQVAGMREASPAHVRDMKESVDSAQINERAVVGEVLDRAGENGVFAKVLEGLGALRVLFFLENLLAGDNDVAALLVQLDDADFNLLAEIAIEIADRTNLKLRARQKRLHADVDGEAAFDAADDRSHDRSLVVCGFFNRVPDAETLRLLVADEITAFRLLALDHDFDLLTGLELHGAGVVDHLLDRN